MNNNNTRCRRKTLCDKLDYNHVECDYALNKIVLSAIRRRNISFEELTDLFHTVFIQNGGDERTFESSRNHLFKCIVGNNKLTYRRFEFVMNEILNEPIPNDAEVTHIKNISKGKDISGVKFNKLTPTLCVGTNVYNSLLWLCKCDCGNTVIVQGCSLRNGHTKSCGCYHKEVITTHGKSKSKVHRSWEAMIERCYDIKHPHYNNYGGRGIGVCDRWRHSFENFYEDMGDRPQYINLKGDISYKSLDRIDGDMSYCKENCQWATSQQQANNRSNNIRFDDGVLVSKWARDNNIQLELAKKMYYDGLSKTDILRNNNGNLSC